MARTIDYTAFPHIIEAILNVAPYASLVRLRQTSRAIRDLVDLRLCQHLIVGQDEISATACRSAIGGRILRKDWYLNPNLARAVRVVDLFPINERTYNASFVDLVAPRLTNIEVVRLVGSGPDGRNVQYITNLSAPTAIAFADLFPRTQADWDYQSLLIGERSLRKVKTAIVHVRFDSEYAAAAPSRYAHVGLGMLVTHCILIFSPVSDYPNIVPAAPPSTVRHAGGSTEVKEGLLFELAFLISLHIVCGFVNSNPCRFTFVGLDRVPETWSQHPDVERPVLAELEAARPDMVSMFRITVLDYLRQRPHLDEAAFMDRLRFISAAEWREEVGERMYNLAMSP